MEKRRVLILCTGNSARSQMAEGLINHLLEDQWEAYSAGIKPSGRVHPLAIAALADLGIDISGHRTKSTEEFRGQDFDVVITVCDHAAKNCPTWLGKGKQTHIGFADPAAAEGSEADKLTIFREVRDGIRQEVLGFLERWETDTSQDRPNFIIGA
jgi:arsenate reductase (thioredoxin)